MKQLKQIVVVVFATLMLVMLVVGCGPQQGAEATSGVKKLDTKVPVRSDGKTIEQYLVERRLQEDNKIGSSKFVYCGSAMTGDLIYQSMAEGKVVSSGKRLSPKTINYTNSVSNGFAIDIGGRTVYTQEVLGDDGTYGDSIPYLYWFDPDNTYYQQYITGGTFFLVTSRPVDFQKMTLRVKQYSDANGLTAK